MGNISALNISLEAEQKQLHMCYFSDRMLDATAFDFEGNPVLSYIIKPIQWCSHHATQCSNVFVRSYIMTDSPTATLKCIISVPRSFVNDNQSHILP